jgi:hypothetical protein
MASGRFHLKLNRTFAIVLGAIALLVISPTYYAQTQGVCLKSARVLSDEELRKAVLVDMVNITVRQAYDATRTTDSDYYWVGINNAAQETDIKKLIEASYNNGKSFEENFGLTVLFAGRKAASWGAKKYENLTSDQLIEPFILMTYAQGRRDADAQFILSNGIKEIPFEALSDKLKKSAADEIGFEHKLLGYGNHYFRIYSPSWLLFEQNCCDNSGQDAEDYQENKRKAYSRSLKGITSHAEMMEDSPFIIKVSNCGDILTNRSGSNYDWLGE